MTRVPELDYSNGHDRVRLYLAGIRSVRVVRSRNTELSKVCPDSQKIRRTRKSPPSLRPGCPATPAGAIVRAPGGRLVVATVPPHRIVGMTGVGATPAHPDHRVGRSRRHRPPNVGPARRSSGKMPRPEVTGRRPEVVIGEQRQRAAAPPARRTLCRRRGAPVARGVRRSGRVPTGRRPRRRGSRLIRPTAGPMRRRDAGCLPNMGRCARTASGRSSLPS